MSASRSKPKPKPKVRPKAKPRPTQKAKAKAKPKPKPRPKPKVKTRTKPAARRKGGVARGPRRALGARKPGGAAPATVAPAAATSRLEQLARDVRLVLLDVDGILTDGHIVLGETRSGDEFELKSFSVRDGFGLTLARAAGYRLGILTGRTSGVVDRRAREIGFDVVEQGHFDKTAGFHAILRAEAVDPSQVLYMGDDLLDLSVLTRVGFPVTVPDAPEAVRRVSVYVTEKLGGFGAVREVMDLLLDLTGRKERALRVLGINLPD